jgi:hypothetical protein
MVDQKEVEYYVRLDAEMRKQYQMLIEIVEERTRQSQAEIKQLWELQKQMVRNRNMIACLSEQVDDED